MGLDGITMGFSLTQRGGYGVTHRLLLIYPRFSGYEICARIYICNNYSYIIEYDNYCKQNQIKY